ncbi:hypothetical protein QFC19_004114 [Naganishia cerealis]|uniref:Uncharacterized protein n=1 Tax=Naganishia cerealis TaxID=610337 RepID=A0ACC2VZ32_9TREE|nr:hypothetical protein QFC19_004114 [Naganishia cerealis]
MSSKGNSTILCYPLRDARKPRRIAEDPAAELSPNDCVVIRPPASYTRKQTYERYLDAKYRYHPPPIPLDQEYMTTSTIPVTSSLQAVPPPSASSSSASLTHYGKSSQDTKGSSMHLERTENAPFAGRKATPLPAMQPLHEVVKENQQQEQSAQGRKEVMSIQGVAVPPKPVPPASDALAEAVSALESAYTPRSAWPDEIRAFDRRDTDKDDGGAAMFGSPRRSMEDSEEKEARVQQRTRQEIMKDVLQDVDPALRAFLE